MMGGYRFVTWMQGFDGVLDSMWEWNNRGKLYEHNVAAGIIGGSGAEDDDE